MDFALSTTATQTCDRMWDFMRDHVFPAEREWAAHLDAHGPHTYPPVMDRLKAEARDRALWNLFLPKYSGLTNVEYGSSPVLPTNGVRSSLSWAERIRTPTSTDSSPWSSCPATPRAWSSHVAHRCSATRTSTGTARSPSPTSAFP